MEDTLFMLTFSFFTNPTDHLMMHVPIIICGNVLYRHQTKSVRALLNQTQLSLHVAFAVISTQLPAKLPRPLNAHHMSNIKTETPITVSVARREK